MGLFNWFKKAPAQESVPSMSNASAPEPTERSQQASGGDPGVLDPLVEQAKSGTPGAQDTLWSHVYALKSWHFVGRMDGSTDWNEHNPRPFCGVVDGRPMLFAFTSQQRAHAFGVKRGLADSNGVYPILSIQRDASISLALRLVETGLQGLIVDDSVGGGYYAAVANLVPMHAHFTGCPLEESAAKFGLDPVVLLTERAFHTRRVEHIETTIGEVMRLPALWFVDDEEAPEKPVLTVLSDKRLAVAVFTSEKSATKGAATLRAQGTKVCNLMQIQAEPAWNMLKSMHQLGVPIAAINLEFPIRLDEIDALRGKFG